MYKYKIDEEYKIDESKFSNIEIEKTIISGIFRFPDLFIDISTIINKDDFSFKLHQSIWTTYDYLVNKEKSIDYRMVALKIQELKGNYGIDFTPLEYLEALSVMSGVNRESIPVFAAELKKLSGRKTLAQAGLDVVEKMVKCESDKSYGDIVNLANESFNNKITVFEQGNLINQPIDLFKDMQNIIESIGNSPKDDGVICPYPRLRKLYGNFTKGDLYFFSARAKTGKTSWLMNLAIRMVGSLDQNVKILIVDTEMESYRLQYRLLSSLTGVSEYFIRTGKWRNNVELTKKIREAWPVVNLLINRIDHIYVGSSNVDEILSIMRRWHRKNIYNRDNIMGCVIYDYVKLSADFVNMGKNMRPDIEIGLKVDKIKKCATELQVPIITASQTNRTNESRANTSNRINDGSVISMSDMISQFASNIFLLNRLTLEERQEYQNNYGIEPSHSLLNIYSRSQGEEAPGFNDIVKITNGDRVEWVDNAFLFSFNSFNFEEISDIATLINNRKDYKLEDASSFDDQML